MIEEKKDRDLFLIAVKYFHIEDTMCTWYTPPDDCADRPNAIYITRSRGKFPREAAVFWYPHSYIPSIETFGNTVTKDLSDSIYSCLDDQLRWSPLNYESLGGCLTHGVMKYPPRVLIVTTKRGSALYCPMGAVIEERGDGYGLESKVYMLANL